MSTPTKDEQKRMDELNEQFELSKKYLDAIHQRMNDQEELYRTYINAQSYPHSARVFDPRTFRVIETITPRMVANEPTGNFYPVEKGDIATTEILNALIKYDWRRAEMFPKLTNFVKSMLIFGTAFGRTYWDYRHKTKPMMIPKEINGQMVWTPKNKKFVDTVEYDGPNFEALNIYDCFPDPNATDMHNMRWFIYRTFKTIKELEAENNARGMEYWKNLDVLKKAIDDKEKQGKKGGTKPSDITYREHRRVMLSTEEYHGQDDSNPEFVLLIRFTPEGWLYVAPEYDVVLRDIDNPYFHGEMPIIYGVDYPYPGELYGMGEIEPIDRVQRAINAVLNQRLDNVQLVLRNMWKVKKNADVDMHTLVSAPGNIITTGDMDAVEMLQTPDVTGPTFVQTMNYLTSALQNGSGITDYTMGINNEANVSNKTATGTRLIQQEANAQFKLKIQLFNHMVIQKIANQWKDLRMQYTTEGQKLRILGKEKIDELMQKTQLATTDMMGQPIAPGDFETQPKLEVSEDQSFAFLNLLPEDIQPAINGDYDFIAAPSTEQLTDPIALQNNFFAALEQVKDPTWVQGLAVSGKKLNYGALTEKLFNKLELGMDMDDVLEDYQPPTPMQPELGNSNVGMPPGMPGMGGEALGQSTGGAGPIPGATGGIQGIPGAGMGV